MRKAPICSNNEDTNFFEKKTQTLNGKLVMVASTPFAHLS
jgi:hypothetical protein